MCDSAHYVHFKKGKHPKPEGFCINSVSDWQLFSDYCSIPSHPDCLPVFRIDRLESFFFHLFCLIILLLFKMIHKQTGLSMTGVWSQMATYVQKYNLSCKCCRYFIQLNESSQCSTNSNDFQFLLFYLNIFIAVYSYLSY